MKNRVKSFQKEARKMMIQYKKGLMEADIKFVFLTRKKECGFPFSCIDFKRTEGLAMLTIHQQIED